MAMWQISRSGSSTGTAAERKAQPQELPVTLLLGAGEAWLLGGCLAEEGDGGVKMAAGLGQMTSLS